jgi:hypothetical protein
MEGKLALARRAEWAAAQFGTADLGDQRRTQRLVKVAGQMAGNSGGSIPQQTGGGADLKAAYRLFANTAVTHAGVCRPHFEQTRQAASQVPIVFLLQDTAVLNFTSHAACEGLGPIAANPRLRGLHQQTVLAADPRSCRPLGLMYQQLYCRQSRPAGSHDDRRGRRAVPLEKRESYWWIEAIQAIGAPPAGSCWVHVGDRGEDFFGVYDEIRRQGADWLIRLSQDRLVHTPGGDQLLFTYARSLPAGTSQTVKVAGRSGGTPEDVPLRMAAGEVTLRPSKGEKAYRECAPVSCQVVRVWEESPPAGHDRLEWMLCTSLRCDAPEEVRFAARGYSLRWMIEEFHKCEKTGCKVEERRLESVDRLEPLIGLLSVLAVWLLQLKYVARDEPDARARSMFDGAMVDAMARYLGRSPSTLTVGQFWGGIGRLGGHPGRKGDGALGWLRAWRGWQSFQLIMIGAELYREDRRPRCG